MKISYPVKYNPTDSTIDDSVGRTLAILAWSGVTRNRTMLEVDQIGYELAGKINAVVVAVKEDVSRDVASVTPIKKAIYFIKKKFRNEKGEIVELSGRGRPPKNLVKIEG